MASRTKPVTVALEGGGSLGAFAWGALDRLLEEQELHIAVASGASAGAMNAAMLVQGLAIGGPAEAKQMLERFWRRVAGISGYSGLPGMYWLGGAYTGMIAPIVGALRQQNGYRGLLKPFGINPLRGVLDGLLDPSVFGRKGAPMLVVSATRVRTGEPRLFRDAEVTADVLLASACLPDLFPTVEIDGEPYWDGGFASNPPLRMLIEAGVPEDIIIIRATPVARPEAPSGASGIRHRAAEIAFGGPLRQELRNLAVTQRLLGELPKVPGVLRRLRDAHLHMIGAEEEFRALGDSHPDPTWSFLRKMHDLILAQIRHFVSPARSFVFAGWSATMDVGVGLGQYQALSCERERLPDLDLEGIVKLTDLGRFDGDVGS
jgi:NTE family protein